LLISLRSIYPLRVFVLFFVLCSSMGSVLERIYPVSQQIIDGGQLFPSMDVLVPGGQGNLCRFPGGDKLHARKLLSEDRFGARDMEPVCDEDHPMEGVIGKERGGELCIFSGRFGIGFDEETGFRELVFSEATFNKSTVARNEDRRIRKLSSEAACFPDAHHVSSPEHHDRIRLPGDVLTLRRRPRSEEDPQAEDKQERDD
jgi:hypothetical protein